MSLKVNLDYNYYHDSSMPTHMLLTGTDDSSEYCRTPGLEPTANYVGHMLSLYRALLLFDDTFRAKLDLNLEFPKPDLSHNDPNSALLLSEIKLLSDTYFKVYNGSPMEPYQVYKDKLASRLLSFKNQLGADFEGAYIPHVVNETEKLLGTPLFVKLLEIATNRDSQNQRCAIGLINKIFYSYKDTMHRHAGRPEGEQLFREEPGDNTFFVLPSAGHHNWAKQIKT